MEEVKNLFSEGLEGVGRTNDGQQLRYKGTCELVAYFGDKLSFLELSIDQCNLAIFVELSAT